MPDRVRFQTVLEGETGRPQWVCIGGIPDGAKMTLKRAGRLIGHLKSAFVVEMQALEWCVEQLLEEVCMPMLLK